MGARRLGVFGGTFDPPHLGHVAAARAVLEALPLDGLMVTVANDPRGKEPPVAPAALRLEMARAAFGELPRVTVSDLEVRRGGPTYTIDTVESLLVEAPGTGLVLVVGADAAAGLPRWHRSAELASLVEVAVVPRPGTGSPVVTGFATTTVPMAPVDLSSTAVRERLAKGEHPGGLVPEGVVLLILANRLYAP